MTNAQFVIEIAQEIEIKVSKFAMYDALNKEAQRIVAQPWGSIKFSPKILPFKS
jgi:hypothetical protein